MFHRPLVTLVSLLIILIGTPAHAHAQLLVSNPRVGATYYKPLKLVKLVFDDDLINLAGGNAIVVTDPKKRHLETGECTLQGATLTTYLKSFKLYGKYLVTYKVISNDGHPVTAQYPFYYLKKKK